MPMNGMKWLLCSVAVMQSLPAMAQKFPNGDARIMVGYAPGGGTDAMARLLATKVQAKLGVTKTLYAKGLRRMDSNA